jgi:drug/metabolite transporter (DMT)-like permease
MENRKKSIILALLTVLFWSTIATAFKITLKFLSPLHIVFLASCCSTIVIFLTILIRKRFSLIFSVKLNNIINFVLLGFLNPFLYYLILLKAYFILPAQEALVLNYTWSIFLVIFIALFNKKRIVLKSIISILISFTGVFVLISKGNFVSFEFNNMTGVFLAILSAIIWAFYWLNNLNIKFEEDIKLFFEFLSGSIFCLILILFKYKLPSFSINILLLTIYIGTFEMGITFIIWLTALKYSDNPAKVSNLIFLSPFFSLFFINTVLKESLSIFTVLGLLLIIAGTLLQFKK